MPPASPSVVDVIARLVQRGARPAPLDDARLVALEATLGAPLPDELRAFLSEWGEEAPGLIPLAQALAASTRATVAFPHDLAEARGAMRPGEYVFLDTFEPPGTWLLTEEDGLSVHLVVTGDARGTVWLATPHGLAPAYAVVDDEPVQQGFASWYFESLGGGSASAPPAELGPGDDAAAAPRTDDGARSPSLPPGDLTLLASLCAKNADSNALVELPPGRYVLTAPVVFERSVILDGAGQVELVAPPGGPAFDVRAGCLALRGVTIDGGVPGQPVDGEIGVRVEGVGRAHLERVTLRSLGVGLSASDAACVLVRACTLEHCRVGLLAGRQARIDVLDTSVGGGATCVRVEGLAHARLAHCRSSWASDGVRMHSAGGLSVEHCRFEQMGAVAVGVHAGHACVVANLISGAGSSGIYVDGGTARIAGNAVTGATSECITLRGSAVAFVERNVTGSANYGVLVQLDDGCATIARNVVRGENLDGIFVQSGLASVLENHVTGGRQYGVHVLSNWASVRRNDAYRMGRTGFELPSEREQGNRAFDCDWESGRKPKGASFGVLPRDEPGLRSRACAVTGVPCKGPTRVFIVDRAAPTVLLALPILVTMSAGVVVRAERRPEHDALCAWLGAQQVKLPKVVETLLSTGIERSGRTIGAVLVDDGFYLAAAAEAGLADARPAPPLSLHELVDAAFAAPEELRAWLGGSLDQGDRALYARVRTLRDFVRAGGLTDSGRAKGPLVDAVMDGRADASWSGASSFPPEASAPDARSLPFPDLDGLEATRHAPAPASTVPSPSSAVEEDWIELPLTERSAPYAWIAPLPGAAAIAWVGEAAGAFPRTGLWPLLIDELGGLAEFEVEERPELGDTTPDAALASARAFLRARWTEEWERRTEDEDGGDSATQSGQTDPRLVLAPFGADLPEPAPAPKTASPLPDEDTVARAAQGAPEAAVADHRFVVLVRCAQPSDALRVLGWSGTANHYLEPRAFTSVLRAWHARFGAVPIAVTRNTIEFAVARPPAELDAARQLAAEQFAMCPDLVDQGAGTLEAVAAHLVDSPRWWLWWD